MMEEVFVKRLKEEVMLIVEKEKMVNYEREMNKRRHALMNSDHWKASTSRISNYSIPVWYANGSRYRVGWKDVDQVFMPINETDSHWCLAQLDLRSRVVTFYDSGITYDHEWRDWYITLRECLQ
ncbi:phospholipase-like protein, partial [Tanacetum coccineum]